MAISWSLSILHPLPLKQDRLGSDVDLLRASPAHLNLHSAFPAFASDRLWGQTDGAVQNHLARLQRNCSAPRLGRPLELERDPRAVLAWLVLGVTCLLPNLGQAA
jgi:hypothetical protein